MNSDEYTRTIYSIAHDLSAPLRGLDGFSTILLETYQDQLDEQGIKLLLILKENAVKAQAMLNSIVSYSQITSTTYPLVEINLNQLIDQILTKNNYFNHHYSNQPTPSLKIANLPTIKGSDELWDKLLSALLDNAFKFQHKDKIPTIEVSTTQEKNSWSLLIADNGIGIKEQNYDIVTRMFSRLHSEKEYPGDGMGLAYCQQIINLYDGSITFDQSALGGLLVTCTFPNRFLA
ncbi:sensor histidine kinase [Spartinivicinus poritis]|uniref:histidine kinase n=1 Tax=Spartinivicinus poritis TaxID=2994640 RepID=A0ABT5UCC3_9GAMM|nr:ATP-binding protein [Spartinivicinus sp. A2-2]MDE1462749.1 ATP-binding protein [Spartinivicinus sp. A2-2]